MKYLISFALVIFAFPAFSQEDLNARDPRLNEGQMFTVQFTPGTKRFVVSLAGKPEVEIGPGQVLVFGRAFGPKGEVRKLDIRPSGTAFTVGDKLVTGQKFELEIRENRENGKKQILKMEAP